LICHIITSTITYTILPWDHDQTSKLRAHPPQPLPVPSHPLAPLPVPSHALSDKELARDVISSYSIDFEDDDVDESSDI
jgi:hypothetical protein